MNKTEKEIAEAKDRALNKPFQITSVCRADLVSQGYKEEEVLNLDDSEMENIANKMADAYCEMGFWDSLEAMADYYKLTQE